MRRVGIDEVDFRRLADVPAQNLIALMSHPKVLAHLPLAGPEFDEEACASFVAVKEAMWEESGYGPWALYARGQFAGWGGLQPEQGEIDLGMVLHPDYWGIGSIVVTHSLRFAFGELNAASVIALLPPSRSNLGAMQRLGFERDGELEIEGERFIRFRTRPVERRRSPVSD